MEEMQNEVENTNNNNVFIVNGVANYSFIKESLVKIAIFSFIFSIFYPIGYFYKQWKEIKRNNESYKNISPFWRGIFYPIYIFPFTKIVKDLIAAKENIEFKKVTLSEEKTALRQEYKKLKNLTVIPYVNLIAFVIALVHIVLMININSSVNIFVLSFTPPSTLIIIEK